MKKVKVMGLAGLMGLMWGGGYRTALPSADPMPAPVVDRAAAHAVIDQAFDLIDASRNRVVLEPLRSDLSASDPTALSTPEKLTQ